VPPDDRRQSADQLTRLADRLRTLPESRLTRSEDRLDGESLATTCHAFAQWCADMARPGLVVPRLSDLASGDQVLVLGRDLLARLPELSARDQVTAELRTRLAALRAVA